MVICATIAMLLISVFALKISSIILLLVAACVGLIVYAVETHTGKEAHKNDLS